MSNTLMSLAEQYRDCNLLLPATSEAQLNPFYKLKVEVVSVDLSENSGDVYKIDANGFGLSKPMLYKLAMAAGIQFNPRETYGEQINDVTYRAHAQGAIRKADGMVRTECDQKEISYSSEKSRAVLDYTEKANEGIEDYRQATEASRRFNGHWEEVVDYNGQPKINQNGYPVKRFVIDKEDREKYIERSVDAYLSQQKKSWAEKALTGAKLRVIRALLGIKNKYTVQELQRSFAIPSVVFSPDYNDPLIKQAMFTQAAGSMTNMFGITQIAPVQRIDFDTKASTFDAEAELENPAFISDRELDDTEDYQAPEETQYIPEPEPEPVQAAPVPPQPAPRAANPAPTPQQTAGYTCCVCGKTIGKNVYDYSMRVHKKALCMDCQKKEKGRNRR